jgi:hypothetical protein
VPGTDSGVCAPEYQNFEQNHPVGYLAGDMRHRGSLWLQYNLPTALGRFNVSLLERFHSGLPYPRPAAIDIRQSATLPDGIANPATSLRRRASGTTSVSAASTAPTRSRRRLWPELRVAVVPRRELLRADGHHQRLNEQGIEYPATARGNVIDQTVFVRRTRATLTAFNPFTTTPVEGTHFAKSATFGQPTNREAYQDPREYRLSIGVRF